MDLASYQHLYIKTVYEYFQEKADWPTYRQIEMKLLPTYRDFDVVEVARSLVLKPYRDTFQIYNLKTPVHLSIGDIRQCPGAEQDLENLIKVVRYSADKYINSKENQVEIFSEEIISKLHMEKLAVRKVGLMIPDTLIILAMQNDIANARWNFVASKDIVRFDGVKSIDDFFKKRDALYKARGITNSIGNALVDPAPLIEKIAQTNPTNIQETTANLMQIDNSYYINALKQSQRSFNWALIVGGVGVAFFITAVFILIFRQPISQSYVAAIITASSGGVVEIIAGVILTLHGRASDKENLCHDRLNRMQRFLVAISHCENLEGDLKHTTRAELIKKLGDIQQ